MKSQVSPFLVRDFLLYVIRNRRPYVFNVKHSDHLAVDYRDFFAYAYYVRGEKITAPEAVGLFKTYAPLYLDELIRRGLVREYKIEKEKRVRPAKVHIFLNGKANVEAAVDATNAEGPSPEPEPRVHG